MKQITIILCLICTAFCFTFKTNAQLSIDAEYRSRFEMRDGYRQIAIPDNMPSFIISQRTRLSFNYKTENIKLRITPQDVRVWGNEQLASSTGVYGDKASLDLLEGYAEIKVGNKSWLSVGRQQLNYDRQRLLAARNWNQNGLSYDAVVLKLNLEPWTIHAGGSWNSLAATIEDNLYLPNRIKSLNFLWANRAFANNLNFSFLHIASGVTETDSTNTLHFRQTTGIYADYKNGNTKLRGNAYYQYGKNNSGNSISAFLIDAEAAFPIGKLEPGIGLSYLSGDANVNDANDHLFNQLYGARHRFFGHMDYFRNFKTHTNQGGLTDLFAYLAYKINSKIRITNIGHYFQLAQTNSITPNDKKLGYENELMVRYKFYEWGSIKSGYLFYLPTDSFKTLQGYPNGEFSQFFYLEITLKPNLFNSKTNTI